jgi:transcription initiation factor TFIID TATA-box-binding protein
MPDIQIRNVIASFSIGHEVDLEEVRRAFAKECFFETLNDKKFTFRVVALRFYEPKMTLLIYRTGKVICTGAKTVEDAEQSANYFVSHLRKSGFANLTRVKAKIQNIVATADVKTSIDIERLVNDIREEKQFHVMYEPEQFPAVIIKFTVVQGSKATILLFGSGKLVCVGLTRYRYIEQALKLLISRIRL